MECKVRLQMLTDFVRVFPMFGEGIKFKLDNL